MLQLGIQYRGSYNIRGGDYTGVVTKNMAQHYEAWEKSATVNPSNTTFWKFLYLRDFSVKYFAAFPCDSELPTPRNMDEI